MTLDQNIQDKVENTDANKKAQIKLIVCRVLAYALLIFLTVLCLIFFYILVINATKSKEELYGLFIPLPSIHFFDNMRTAFISNDTVNILSGLGNSFLVSALTAILTAYFSALTAYAVHAYRFRGRKIIATFILVILMIPPQVSSVGFVQLALQLKLNNYLFLLILPSIASPSVYFYMLQYLKATLPLDLVEASRMDGSSEFMTFNRIVIPIMKPAIAVQLIFTFVASWNNYYLPALLIDKPSKRTLPIMLGLLRSQAQSQVDAGQIWMFILLSILPVIVVYLFLSKSIIKGVTSGSVKG